jgi:hypothetical protein
VVATAHGRPVAVLGFTVRDGRITEIDILADAQRLWRLHPAVVPEPPIATGP